MSYRKGLQLCIAGTLLPSIHTNHHYIIVLFRILIQKRRRSSNTVMHHQDKSPHLAAAQYLLPILVILHILKQMVTQILIFSDLPYLFYNLIVCVRPCLRLYEFARSTICSISTKKIKLHFLIARLTSVDVLFYLDLVRLHCNVNKNGKS